MANRSTGGTTAKVAQHATQKSRLAPNSMNLLGVFGPSDDLSALVRMPGGRTKKVSRGSRVGRARVVAIDSEGLLLQKGGATERMAIPGS